MEPPVPDTPNLASSPPSELITNITPIVTSERQLMGFTDSVQNFTPEESLEQKEETNNDIDLAQCCGQCCCCDCEACCDTLCEMEWCAKLCDCGEICESGCECCDGCCNVFASCCELFACCVD